MRYDIRKGNCYRVEVICTSRAKLELLVLSINLGNFVAIREVLFLAVGIVLQVGVAEQVSVAGNINKNLETREVSRGTPH